MTATLAAVILTRDEEANIARTLSGLAWVDEIVVVDSFSADATCALVRGFPKARMLQRRFDNHAEQWSFAVAQTSADWVLAFDADYVAPPEFAAEARQAADGISFAAYSAAFRYCVQGRPLRASLYPPRVVMFRRGHGRFVQCGHTQRLIVDGEVGRLSTKLRHDDRKPLGRWIEAQMRYARLEAEYLASRPTRELRLVDRLRRTGWLAPFAVFLHAWLGKGLWREGGAGWSYVLQRTLFELVFCLAWLERAQADEAPRLDWAGEPR